MDPGKLVILFHTVSKRVYYVSPLEGLGDILFFPLHPSVCPSVRHKIVSAL